MRPVPAEISAVSVPPAQAGGSRESAHAKGVTAHELLSSSEFKALVRTRWRVSGVLTVVLFAGYYGFILLVAINRGLLATRVGQSTTLGIVLGVAVLVGAWLLTAAYVVWANREFDPEVRRLRARLRGQAGPQ